MLDRLSAGVAQFGRDRSLIFFNQPFARLFSLPADFAPPLKAATASNPDAVVVLFTMSNYFNNVMKTDIDIFPNKDVRSVAEQSA